MTTVFAVEVSPYLHLPARIMASLACFCSNYYLIKFSLNYFFWCQNPCLKTDLSTCHPSFFEVLLILYLCATETSFQILHYMTKDENNTVNFVIPYPHTARIKRNTKFMRQQSGRKSNISFHGHARNLLKQGGLVNFS